MNNYKNYLLDLKLVKKQIKFLLIKLNYYQYNLPFKILKY